MTDNTNTIALRKKRKKKNQKTKQPELRTEPYSLF